MILECPHCHVKNTPVDNVESVDLIQCSRCGKSWANPTVSLVVDLAAEKNQQPSDSASKPVDYTQIMTRSTLLEHLQQMDDGQDHTVGDSQAVNMRPTVPQLKTRVHHWQQRWQALGTLPRVALLTTGAVLGLVLFVCALWSFMTPVAKERYVLRAQILYSEPGPLVQPLVAAKILGKLSAGSRVVLLDLVDGYAVVRDMHNRVGYVELAALGKSKPNVTALDHAETKPTVAVPAVVPQPSAGKLGNQSPAKQPPTKEKPNKNSKVLKNHPPRKSGTKKPL